VLAAVYIRASVLTGLRHGVNSFLWTTALETINVSFKIMAGTHVRARRWAGPPGALRPAKFARETPGRPGAEQVLLVAASNSISPPSRPEPMAVTAVFVHQPTTIYEGARRPRERPAVAVYA